MNEKLQEISSLLQAGNVKKCKEAVNSAIEEGLDAKTILDKGLLAGMDIVGTKFKANEVFVPEVLVSARCMNKTLEILKPLLLEGGSDIIGTVVIGTVKGDLHDIGKNLVSIMMQSKGLTVIDLGVDVSSEKVKIMIGGAPITDDFCKKIGADIYSVDGSEAADAAYKVCLN